MDQNRWEGARACIENRVNDLLKWPELVAKHKLMHKTQQMDEWWATNQVGSSLLIYLFYWCCVVRPYKVSEAIGGKGHPCTLGVNRIETQHQGSS